MLLNLIAVYLALQTVPFLALVPTLPYTVYHYLRTKSVNVWRCTYFYSFVLYFLCAYFMTILPIPTWEVLDNVRPISELVQLIPFANFASIKQETLLRDIAVLVFNVVLTVPLGFYMRALYDFNLKKTAAAGFGVALFFELSQLTGVFFLFPRPWRIFDVDDLMINTLGALVGYALTPLAMRLLPGTAHLKTLRLFQGGEVSFRRRFVSGAIDMGVVLGLSATLSASLALIVDKSIIRRWQVVCLAAFAIVMLIAMCYGLLCGATTLGNRMTGLHLTTEKGKPASRFQCASRMVLEHVCVTAIPFWVFFSIRISADSASIKNVLWLSLATFLMLCAARNMLEMLFNAVTHGSSMFYDRATRTHLSYGYSKKSILGIRVLDILPLTKPNIAQLSKMVHDTLSDTAFGGDTISKVCRTTESVLSEWMDDGLQGTMCELRLDKHFCQKALILSVPLVQNKPRAEAAKNYVDKFSKLNSQMEIYCTTEKNVCIIHIP